MNDTPTMEDEVVALFQQVLFFLLSLIFAGSFPLEALALLPPLQRRRLFLLLPLVDLHRLPPSVTEGIDMDKFWKEILKERLCQTTQWLTKPTTLTLIYAFNRCSLSSSQNSDILNEEGVCYVLFAVPLKENVSMRRNGVFQQIKRNICLWSECGHYNFYCSPKYLHLFASYSSLTKLNSFFIEAVTVLSDIFPLKLEGVIVKLPVSSESVITKVPFHYILRHVNALEIHVHVQDSQYFSQSSDSFLEALLEGLISNPSTLQYLYLNIGYDRSHQRYDEVVSTIASFFSAMLKSQDVIPLLSLKVVKIAANFRMLKSMEIEELAAIFSSQEHLETLEISAKYQCYTSAAVRHSLRICLTLHKEIFQVMVSCFQKPYFQCLILEDLHVEASELLNVEYHFLKSTACRKQQLVLRNLWVHGFDKRKDITYAPESTVCTKSLSVINCRIEEEVDIASGILLYPGIQELRLHASMSPWPDHADIYKLTTALEKGTGTLRCLDLSRIDLSSIIVDASPLFGAIFHLSHLSELELVLKNCCLKADHLNQLYHEWERTSRGQALRKLCVCGNALPVDPSNLERMAKTLCGTCLY